MWSAASGVGTAFDSGLSAVGFVHSDDAPEAPAGPGFFEDGEGGAAVEDAGVFEVDVLPAVGAFGLGHEEVDAAASGFADGLIGVEAEGVLEVVAPLVGEGAGDFVAAVAGDDDPVVGARGADMGGDAGDLSVGGEAHVVVGDAWDRPEEEGGGEDGDRGPGGAAAAGEGGHAPGEQDDGGEVEDALPVAPLSEEVGPGEGCFPESG